MDNKIERTLILFKPDAVQRGIVGEILTRFERVGLKIVGTKMIFPDKSHYHKHYEDIGKMVEIVRLSGPGKARVKYRGAEWDAQVNDSVNPGDFVKIIKIDGIMLICSKT